MFSDCCLSKALTLMCFFESILQFTQTIMKFQPPELPTNRTSEQWSWLKKIFTDELVINKIREDAHQLTFLRSYAEPELFSIIDGATSFTNGLAKLDRQFQKPTRVMYARHHLLSCKQRDDESEFSFFKRLQLLVENANVAPFDPRAEGHTIT